MALPRPACLAPPCCCPPSFPPSFPSSADIGFVFEGEICPTPVPKKISSKRQNARRAGGKGEELWLQSQEGQDLSAAAGASQIILKMTSEHQTVDHTNKIMGNESRKRKLNQDSLQNFTCTEGDAQMWQSTCTEGDAQMWHGGS